MALIVVVLVSAFAHVWAPQSQPYAAQQSSAPSASTTAGKQSTPSADANAPSGPFVDKIEDKIRAFYSNKQVAKDECADANVKFYCVPERSRAGIRFVIATVPDPIHSHLSYYFDRAIEAIEQGASNEGYSFDRAIMPWPYADASSTTDGSNAFTVELKNKSKLWDSGVSEDADKVPQESLPGLMIFRENEYRLKARRGDLTKPDPKFDPRANSLFVFVVGETPTAGINADQFRNAADIISAIRAGLKIEQGMTNVGPDFGVLGPTFSGSLYSLRDLLQDLQDERAPAWILPVYSTATGTTSIKWFNSLKPGPVQMVRFQQDSDEALHALEGFASGLHYAQSDIAVLSEDETAYGSTAAPPTPSTQSTQPNPPPCAENCAKTLSAPHPFYLYFPREISQLRSEYSKEISNQSAASTAGQLPQTNLRLDLELTGKDDDSVAPYAIAQTAVSQQAVMRAIVLELDRHEAKFILLRASDPMDELFLASYLHDNYPQGRLVVPSPDLLLTRQEDAPLDGVLALNTYPLEPAALNTQCPGFDGVNVDGEFYGASQSVAAYNATTALIKEMGRLRGDPVEDDPSTQTAGQAESNAESIAEGRKKRTAASDIYQQEDLGPCGLSSRLWLTVVSSGAIRPLKVLSASGSMFFPFSSAGEVNEDIQIDGRVPLTWFVAYILFLAVMFRHAWLSYTGGDFGAWQTAEQLNRDLPGDAKSSRPGGKLPLQRRAFILWLGGLILVAIPAILASPWTPIVSDKSCWPYLEESILVWILLLAFVLAIAINFWSPRKEKVLAVSFFLASLVIMGSGMGYAYWIGKPMVLWQQRVLDLASGVSSTMPLLFLFVAFYGWFLYAFRAEALIDWRRPKLLLDNQTPNAEPAKVALPYTLYNLGETMGENVREVMSAFSLPWVVVVGLVAVACLEVPSVLLGPGRIPVRSLEGLLFDGVYCLLLGVAIVMLIATLLRLIELWSRFSVILMAMDRVGLREAIRRLKGFEWNVIWNPARSVKDEANKMTLREIQLLECLLADDGDEAVETSPAHAALKEAIDSIMQVRRNFITIISEPGNRSKRQIDHDLMPLFNTLQTKFAETAGLLWSSYLDKYWQRSCLAGDKDVKDCEQPDDESSSANAKIGSAIATGRVGTFGVNGLSLNGLRLAEDFVASVYANFLSTVLLGVRGLVFTVVSVYACIVLSTVFYPFVPGPSLTILSIALFALSGGIIGYIYEEMHRDATLSRMTSTVPGKLDPAFWTKFLAAGLVPLLSLMVSVFPQAGHFLYSLVQPILQGLR